MYMYIGIICTCTFVLYGYYIHYVDENKLSRNLLIDSLRKCESNEILDALREFEGRLFGSKEKREKEKRILQFSYAFLCHIIQTIENPVSGMERYLLINLNNHNLIYLKTLYMMVIFYPERKVILTFG